MNKDIRSGIMMGKTDLRGLYLLEELLENFPNPNYKDIDIQTSLNQYELFRQESGFDEIYGDPDRTMQIGENKFLHVFEHRNFELPLFNSNDMAITSASIYGGGFKVYLNENQTEELFIVQSIELK